MLTGGARWPLSTGGEGEIRKKLIEANLVDCMMALPGQLFYSTQIPPRLWFLARGRKDGRFRDLRGEPLFITMPARWGTWSTGPTGS